MNGFRHYLVTSLLLQLELVVVDALSNTHKEIYGIPDSGWTSDEWNWGKSSSSSSLIDGKSRSTSHDCAMICRCQYATIPQRQTLIDNLLEPSHDPSKRKPENFEEVKLVLALVIQNYLDDDDDESSSSSSLSNVDLGFGPGGYGDILRNMIEAKRYEEYENDDSGECSADFADLRFVQDMQDRFDLLADNTSLELRDMRSILDDYHEDDDDDMDYIRRRCCGLVLEAMGFVENNF